MQRKRKTPSLWILLTVALVLGRGYAEAQEADPVAAVNDLRWTPDAYTLSFVSSSYAGNSASVDLESTVRHPSASGEAKVERQAGRTEIEVELDEMKPAWHFGGEFSTYVLWAISPEGHIDNLGEFILRGNRSKLNVSTTLETFGMLVTAEPHFLTPHPSPFVVLASGVPKDATPRTAERSEVRFELKVPYRFAEASLAASLEASGVSTSALRQAEVAVQLAGRVLAEQRAPEAWREAEDALRRAQGAAETRADAGHPDVELMAYRAVRLAVRAQNLAMETSP